MARIRSIHAELATDEAYMSMSLAAKAAWPLLWTQCDDQGVFEWKPLVLKARILPADMIDFGDILTELERLDRVRRFEINGRQMGVVRNFCRFQRPKKPKYTLIIPPEYRTYVGSDSPSGELDDDDAPRVLQKGEISPQMEREGEREREREKEGEKDRTDNSEDGALTPRVGGRRYAFEARTIRLTSRDFGRWEASFPHLSLRAELEQLDEWAGQQGRKWFQAVAGALAKRERSALERAANARAGPSNDIDPRLG